MENESIVIKKALAIVNENNTELKNVFANKSSKLASSLTPPSPPPSSPSSSPQFYIVEITADQVVVTYRFQSDYRRLDGNFLMSLFADSGPVGLAAINER